MGAFRGEALQFESMPLRGYISCQEVERSFLLAWGQELTCGRDFKIEPF